MKKVILLILASVAVYGNDIKECLGGDVKSCEKVANTTFHFYPEYILQNWRAGGHATRVMKHITCNDYMKVIRKGCNLGSGFCCALLGDELHPISVNSYGNWEPKYGVNCSLRNQNDAFKYYKKACELGESAGCQRYTELQNDLYEIDSRERDKTQKGDITVRQK